MIANLWSATQAVGCICMMVVIIALALFCIIALIQEGIKLLK